MCEVESNATALVPRWERPTAGMGEAAMLDHVDVAFAIDVAPKKGAAVEVSEGSSGLLFADRRPECRHGKPCVPERTGDARRMMEFV